MRARCAAGGESDAVSEQAQSERPNVLDTSAAGGLILRGGALRLLSYVTVIALSLVPTVLLTRHLGKTGFQAYTTVGSLVALVTAVTDAGMSNLGTREFAVLEGTARDSLMRDLLGLRIALTLLGVLFAIGFALAAGYDTALLAGTVTASVATIALVLQHTLTIPLSAELRLGTLSLLEVARQALTLVAIVALVLAGAGVFPLLTVTLVVYALLVPLTAAATRRNTISLELRIRPRRWLALLRPTIAFSLATAVGSIYVYTAQIITSLVANHDQSAAFAVSFRVFMVTVTVPGLLVGGAIPLLARTAHNDRQRLAYALQRIFEVSLILGAGAALGFLAGAPFVVSVVGGPKYAGAVTPLRIQGAAMIASFLVAGWGFALLSLKRYRALLVVNGLALAASCTLTLLLARAHGAAGAALATLCGEALLAIGCALVLTWRSPELRPRLATLPKVALAAAPALAIAFFVQLPSLPLAVVTLAAYALVIAATRALPRELVELLPGRRPTHPSSPGGAG